MEDKAKSATSILTGLVGGLVGFFLVQIFVSIVILVGLGLLGVSITIHQAFGIFLILFAIRITLK